MLSVASLVRLSAHLVVPVNCHTIPAFGIDANNDQNAYSPALPTQVLYPWVQATHRLFVCITETIVCVAPSIIGRTRYWLCTGGEL